MQLNLFDACLLLFFSLLSKGNGMELQYFSNFKFESVVFGKEHLIKDYITLANDPNENLPDSYTVCSSVFVKWHTTHQVVIQMLQQNGSPWYLLQLSDRTYDSLTWGLKIWYENPVTGTSEYEVFSNTGIPIVPHSWYHICMGLDTVSGLLRIVVNGREVINEEKEYFKNTFVMKPASLAGKVLLFKGYLSGIWYQYRNTISNMNFFKSLMTVKDMVAKTAGSTGCSSLGDYLRFIFLNNLGFHCLAIHK